MKNSLLALAACAMLSGSANAAMYLIGAPADPYWSPAKGIEMEEVDGGWKWSGFVGETDYFAFATQLADPDNIDWDDFNANCRISPDDGDGTEAATGVYGMHLGAPATAFHGTGQEVTYFVQKTGDAYTLTVTEKDSKPLYLIGQVDGGDWSPMTGIKMKNVNGGWEWSGYLSERDYFGFATQLMDEYDWDTLNANYRLSPVEEYAQPEALPGEYELRFGTPEGSFHGYDINVKLKLFVKEVDGKYTLTVSEEKVENPWPDDAVWGVVGAFNDWGNSGEPDVQMTEVVPGVWTATLKNFSGDFKFRANESWEFNFGPAYDGPSTISDYGVYAIGFNSGNFNVPEVLDEVIFTLDLNSLQLTVAKPSIDVWGVVGEFNSWGEEPDFRMTEVGPGLWTATFDNLVGKFKFRANENWDFNLGASTSNSSSGYVIDADGLYSLVMDGKDFIFNEAVEDVTFELDVYNNTLKVSGLSGEPVDTDLKWGVVGAFNDWGNTGEPDFSMTEIRPGVWKATMYDFSGAFKFRANEKWDFNFGGVSLNYDEGNLIDADGVYDIASNGSNFIIPDEVEEVIFELDLNTMTLSVDGLTPTYLALRGNFIDWQFEWSYLFNEVESGVYMLYLDGVGADWKFKISDQDWTEFYTTGVADMVAGEIYPLIDRDGPDMGVDREYSEVTMFLNVEDEYFSFYGEVVGSVARTEIESGNARYFNMQGVEVKNPSDGIFIRLVNGKSEKITVK